MVGSTGGRARSCRAVAAPTSPARKAARSSLSSSAGDAAGGGAAPAAGASQSLVVPFAPVADIPISRVPPVGGTQAASKAKAETGFQRGVPRGPGRLLYVMQVDFGRSHNVLDPPPQDELAVRGQAPRRVGHEVRAR